MKCVVECFSKLPLLLVGTAVIAGTDQGQGPNGNRTGSGMGTGQDLIIIEQRISILTALNMLTISSSIRVCAGWSTLWEATIFPSEQL